MDVSRCQQWYIKKVLESLLLHMLGGEMGALDYVEPARRVGRGSYHTLLETSESTTGQKFDMCSCKGSTPSHREGVQ